MSPDQGAESSLWAATASKVAESPEKYQGAYLRQPDDDVSAGFERGLQVGRD